MKEEKRFSYHEIALILNRNDRTIWTAYNRTKKKESANENISKNKTAIPSAILRDRTLAVLESCTEYLKEKKKLTYHEIAELLNRNDRTIWTVYNRAKKKRRSKK